jgi:hypothetical protein
VRLFADTSVQLAAAGSVTGSSHALFALPALAEADVLLTLDKADFTGLLGSTFYGLPVMLPYNFLQRERDAGRLPVVP